MNMVQYPEYGTNTPYYLVIIELCLGTKFLNSDEIERLYRAEGLSVNQIALRFKVSRTLILSRLHDRGIREGTASKRRTNPKNYRCPIPPYGFAIQNGRLVPNRQEMKVCRLVVELVEREKKKHTDAARELSRRGLKNRAGSTNWDSKTVFNIFRRWKNKI